MRPLHGRGNSRVVHARGFPRTCDLYFARMGETQPADTVPDVSPDLPTPGWRALLAILAQLPQPGLSRAFGHLADLRIPGPMRRPVFGSFARAVGIALAEAERPLAEYRSLNEFFVRRLRAGV